MNDTFRYTVVKANYNKSGLNSEKPFWSFCYGKKYLLLMHEYEEQYHEDMRAFSRDLPASCVLEAGDALGTYRDHGGGGDDSSDSGGDDSSDSGGGSGGGGGGGSGGGGSGSSGGGGSGSGGGGGSGSSGGGGSGGGGSGSSGGGGSGSGGGGGSGSSGGGGSGGDSTDFVVDLRTPLRSRGAAKPGSRQSGSSSNSGDGSGGDGGTTAKRTRLSKRQKEAVRGQRQANAWAASSAPPAAGTVHVDPSERAMNRAQQLNDLIDAESKMRGNDDWSERLKLQIRERIQKLMEEGDW
jgi:hypothetical protein